MGGGHYIRAVVMSSLDRRYAADYAWVRLPHENREPRRPADRAARAHALPNEHSADHDRGDAAVGRWVDQHEATHRTVVCVRLEHEGLSRED